VGYGGESFVAEEAHITNVAVHPDYHGQKVGTQIMLALTAEARRRGADSIALEVRVSNLVAQSLYRKFGFVPVGVRPRYYLETGEDALVMVARDVASPAYGERLESIRAELERVLPPPTF
jgi:ribosomal-protein-alanine N-acetyltransferase